MQDKVLLVDDDKRVLDGLKRRLYKKFRINTINNAPDALELLGKDNDYAVVVSDQQMPEMDGITFLKELSEKSPNTIRIMLTGNSDQQTAVSSINDGKVFRYLNKPCSMEELSQAITDGLNKYRVDTAERELLEKTLAGSVKLLTDILAMNDPEAFKQITIMKKAARQVGMIIKHPRLWELELTVMLSTLGHVVLPADIRAKMIANEPLGSVEQTIVASAPKAAHDLLQNIPRLNHVAEAIYYKDKAYDGSGYPLDARKGENIPLNARILYLLNQIFIETDGKVPVEQDFIKLQSSVEKFDPKLFSLVKEHFLSNVSMETQPGPGEKDLNLMIEELQPGDRLLENLVTDKGQRALAADNILTETLIHQAVQFNKVRKLKEPVRVRRRAS